MVHAIPALWRLHWVHHADPDFDVTTGSRFHRTEIILSMLIKLAAVTLLGAPVFAVVVFEVLLSSTALFSHSNVRLPARADRVLRWFVVIPDMHRVHHSFEDDETNSNSGFNLPWGDRPYARLYPAVYIERTIDNSPIESSSCSQRRSSRTLWASPGSRSRVLRRRDRPQIFTGT